MDISIVSNHLPDNRWNIPALNRDLDRAAPEDIVEWVATHALRPIISANFRPRSVALIHLVSRRIPGIPVIWVDSGFNTEATQQFVERLTDEFGLNLHVYRPLRARVDASAPIPQIGSLEHDRFTREVKLEPFARALGEWRPDIWITGIRADQNDYRRSLNTISNGPFNTIRVAPFFRWTEVDVEGYIYDTNLPDYEDYFDPTKGDEERECGIQLLA
jgi:phosphoadenosine phosphosulfate reductase